MADGGTMPSESDPPVFNDDDLDEEDDDPSSSSSDAPAIPAVTVALPDPKRHPLRKPPFDDSRRLFQRLWTDQDEIELLQGYLHYTLARGSTSSGHPHHHLDMGAFYDQIKSKLQFEFNKNQLMEKLRRLKKKYRTVLTKITSGKDFVFKSPHDQLTFELSRKIWANLCPNFDDDDHNPNPNSVVAAATPPRPPNSSYVISQINLNSATADHKAGSASSNIHNNSSNNNNNSNNNNAINFDMMTPNLSTTPAAKLSSRKRLRVGGKVEERFGRNVNVSDNDGADNTSNTNNNVNVSSSMQGLIEETVRSCLSPLVKESINNAVNGTVFGGCSRGGGGGVKGVGALALNAVPLNFSGMNLGSSVDGMDDKWRKQQILELEVYLKRLELVQDQIKSSLEELKSMGS